MEPAPEPSLAASPAHESILDKMGADLRVWATLWQVPVTLRLRLRVLLLEPGFQLAFLLRVQEACGAIPVVGVVLRRLVWYVTTILFACHIDPKAVVGGGVHFPHPTGIVIGGESVIGRGVKILQGVTLGIADDGKACPVIEDGVSIFAGAKVLGRIVVGRGARIGANAVVLRDVPAHAVAVGVPARVLGAAREDRA